MSKQEVVFGNGTKLTDTLLAKLSETSGTKSITVDIDFGFPPFGVDRTIPPEIQDYYRRAYYSQHAGPLVTTLLDRGYLDFLERPVDGVIRAALPAHTISELVGNHPGVAFVSLPNNIHASLPTTA